MRSSLLVCLTFFTAVALGCGLPAPSESKAPNKQEKETGSPKDGVGRIFDDFRRDADTATTKHKGKRVVVAGEVEYAKQADKKSKGPHVVLKAGQDKNDMAAAFFTGRDNAAALALKPGQEVQIKGTVLNGFRYESGKAHLTLDDCELVK